MSIFFNSNFLPSLIQEYVVWIDIMGTGPVMGRSMDISANFIFKLHIAALQSKTATIRIYPVMDGFYAASPSQQDMLTFIRGVFDTCADEFILASAPMHRFVVRGALAYGPIIRGQNIPSAATQPPGNAANILSINAAYRDSILIGLPIVQAYSNEGKAPPFGIYVHDTARSFSPPGSAPIHFVWWKWGTGGNPNPNWQNLLTPLKAYYAWCRQNSHSIEYATDRIDAHEAMATEYLS